MAQQRSIPAVFMRGGTSKGVFFYGRDLPDAAAERDQLLLRVIGSPDPYGRQIDGMGGATSSTSKVAIISPGTPLDCDVDFLLGRVAIGEPIIDYSGNCANLTAAVAQFAIQDKLLKHSVIWESGVPYMQPVLIWQLNTRRRILAEVQCLDGEPLSCGTYHIDGVAGGGSRITLHFLDLAAAGGAGGVLPLGHPVTALHVPGFGALEVSLIDAGSPTVFVRAADLGLRGTEFPDSLNAQPDLLARCEAVRASAAVLMGLAETLEAASSLRPATPCLAMVAPAADFTGTDGRPVSARDCHLLARIFSAGRVHHAFTGTGAVALAVAAAIPGTLVRQVTSPGALLDEGHTDVIFGHAAGLMDMGARVSLHEGCWRAEAAMMGRTARRLMQGSVCIPLI